jgi:hypothetical protein
MVITTDTCGIAERRVLLKSVQRVHGNTKGHINRTYSITKDFGAGLPPTSGPQLIGATLKDVTRIAIYT